MQAHGRTLAQQLVDELHEPPRVHVLERHGEGLPPVEHQEQVRPAPTGPVGGSLLPHAVEPCGAQRRPAAGRLGEQPLQEAVDALGVVEPDDGAGVGERGQRGEPAPTTVDGVEVDVVRRHAPGERTGQAAQHGGAAGAGGTEYEQVRRALQVEHEGPAPLLGGDVEQPVDQSQAGRGRAGGLRQHRRGRQGRQPR